jgi:hypothetical protein
MLERWIADKTCSDCSSRLTVLFLLAFLDRTNIGNAKIQGMTAELKMGGHDYNIALFVFFIPVSYILLHTGLLYRWAC